MNDSTKASDSITPIHYKRTTDIDFRPATQKEINQGEYVSMRGGLTKREYFSALAMQGLLAQMPERTSSDQIAKEAVMCADKLIESLNK